MSMPPPPPNYGAAAPQMAVPFASWGQRVAAYFVNVAMLLLLFIPILIVSLILGAVSDALGGLFLILAYLALLVLSFYWYFQEGAKGQSPGKKVMGIQVVNADTGQFIGGGMGIARSLVNGIINGIPCYIGFLWPLWDAKKQTLADKVLKTVVIAGPKQDFMSALKSSIPGMK
jgi:uncharacterized RDD family membrane protein YckC